MFPPIPGLQRVQHSKDIQKKTYNSGGVKGIYQGRVENKGCLPDGFGVLTIPKSGYVIQISGLFRDGYLQEHYTKKVIKKFSNRYINEQWVTDQRKTIAECLKSFRDNAN